MMKVNMDNLQKWFIIGAIWIIAIALLLGAFRGRYSFFNGESPFVIDSWIGRTYRFLDRVVEEK